MSKYAIYPHDRTPSGLAAEDGLLLISERENKLPLITANEKQTKQNTETVRRANENLCERYRRTYSKWRSLHPQQSDGGRSKIKGCVFKERRFRKTKHSAKCYYLTEWQLRADKLKCCKISWQNTVLLCCILHDASRITTDKNNSVI